MRAWFSFLLLAALASPAAAVDWDESVDGDLSSDPLAPTPLALTLGSNTVTGTVTLSNDPNGDRDYITFVIPAGQILSELTLLAYDPDNLGFAAFNEGPTSFIPGIDTDGNFLSGILPSAADVGFDLMPFFVDRAVTQNALPEPQLNPGEYCFVIQQTSDVVQIYSLDFILSEDPVPVDTASWGKIKQLYR